MTQCVNYSMSSFGLYIFERSKFPSILNPCEYFRREAFAYKHLKGLSGSIASPSESFTLDACVRSVLRCFRRCNVKYAIWPVVRVVVGLDRIPQNRTDGADAVRLCLFRFAGFTGHMFALVVHLQYRQVLRQRLSSTVGRSAVDP